MRNYYYYFFGLCAVWSWRLQKKEKILKKQQVCCVPWAYGCVCGVSVLKKKTKILTQTLVLLPHRMFKRIIIKMYQCLSSTWILNLRRVVWTKCVRIKSCFRFQKFVIFSIVILFSPNWSLFPFWFFADTEILKIEKNVNREGKQGSLPIKESQVFVFEKKKTFQKHFQTPKKNINISEKDDSFESLPSWGNLWEDKKRTLFSCWFLFIFTREILHSFLLGVCLIFFDEGRRGLYSPFVRICTLAYGKNVQFFYIINYVHNKKAQENSLYDLSLRLGHNLHFNSVFSSRSPHNVFFFESKIYFILRLTGSVEREEYDFLRQYPVVFWATTFQKKEG